MQAGRRFDITIPIDGTDDRDFWKSRALIVRLGPGASREAAVAELNVEFQGYLDAVKTVNERARAQYFNSIELVPAVGGLPEFRDRYGKPVQALLGIVCAQVVESVPRNTSSITRRRGAPFGVSSSLIMSSSLSSLLFGVKPAEPLVYVATAVLLLGVALLATVAPTLRAMRIDPVETLRWE